MARRAQEEENHWPGFVDALSTIVMVVTFLLIILGIVIFVLATKVTSTITDGDKAKIEQVIEEGSQIIDGVESPIKPENPQTGPEEKTKTKSPQFSSSDSRKIVEEKTAFVTGEEEKGSEQPDEEVKNELKTGAYEIVELGYETDAVEINSDVDAKIDEHFAKYLDAMKGNKITIKSYAFSLNGSYSQSRRIAYYRAMLMRNKLMKAGVAPEDIEVSVEVSSEESLQNKVKVLAVEK